METHESESCRFILRRDWERDSSNFITLQSCGFVVEGNIITFMSKVLFIFFFYTLILQSFLPIEGRTRGQHPICLCWMLSWCMQNGSSLETQWTCMGYRDTAKAHMLQLQLCHFTAICKTPSVVQRPQLWGRCTFNPENCQLKCYKVLYKCLHHSLLEKST